MSTSTPDPEIVVIKENKDDGSIWMWAIFAIVLIAVILIVVGVCMSNKQYKKVMYMSPTVPQSVASSLQGGSRYAHAMSVAPISQSMLASSKAPMSFMSY